MPRASVRRSAIASSAPRCASSTSWVTRARSALRGVVLSFSLARPSFIASGHQLRLGAVVQVALDAAQPRGRVVHDPGPGLLEGPDPVGQRGRAEQAGA